MSIRFEHTEVVRTTPQQAFALIDDLPRTREWLPPCVGLEKLGSGPNAVGDKLKYVYKHGGLTKEMAGKILARVPGEQLHCLYTDTTFDVSVDLHVAPHADGATTTHIIEITPKRFFAKLFTPLIRVGIRKQTIDAAKKLTALLEA
ncbi:MAG: SRPBCC family protein [Tepidisphaeraceae bacterium]